MTTLLHGTVSFLGRGRSERTVTELEVFARNAIAKNWAMPTRPHFHGYPATVRTVTPPDTGSGPDEAAGGRGAPPADSETQL